MSPEQAMLIGMSGILLVSGWSIGWYFSAFFDRVLLGDPYHEAAEQADQAQHAVDGILGEAAAQMNRVVQAKRTTTGRDDFNLGGWSEWEV